MPVRAWCSGLLALALTGCSLGGAPSFTLFGAFFPAWLLCGALGVVVAIVARVVFVVAGLAEVLPLQFLVCSSIGLLTAIVSWLALFG